MQQLLANVTLQCILVQIILNVFENNCYRLYIVGSPVIVNGDEFENIEMRRASDLLPASSRMDNRPQNGHSTNAGVMSPDPNDNSQLRDMIEINRNLQNLVIGAQTIDVEKRDYSSGYASESGDMLRELMKNKELMRVGRKKELTRFSSVDSDVSEGSTLVSTGSDMENGEKRKRPRINHHAIRSTVSDTDVEQLALVVRTLPKTECTTIISIFVITNPFLQYITLSQCWEWFRKSMFILPLFVLQWMGVWLLPVAFPSLLWHIGYIIAS